MLVDENLLRISCSLWSNSRNARDRDRPYPTGNIAITAAPSWIANSLTSKTCGLIPSLIRGPYSGPRYSYDASDATIAGRRCDRSD